MFWEAVSSHREGSSVGGSAPFRILDTVGSMASGTNDPSLFAEAKLATVRAMANRATIRFFMGYLTF
jgi:hypothetical protein